MTPLQTWLARPRASVRIDTSFRWGGWMKVLRQLSPGTRKHAGQRLQVLDRVSLGGKKSLLLVSVRGQHLLVGVGDAAAPSVTRLDASRLLPRSNNGRIGGLRGPRARKVVGS